MSSVLSYCIRSLVAPPFTTGYGTRHEERRRPRVGTADSKPGEDARGVSPTQWGGSAAELCAKKESKEMPKPQGRVSPSPVTQAVFIVWKVGETP